MEDGSEYTAEGIYFQFRYKFDQDSTGLNRRKSLFNKPEDGL